MDDDNHTDDGGIASQLTRRRLLQTTAAGAAGVVAGLASSQSDSGVGSLGGASPEQDSVPVEDILVVLEDERHDADGSAYNGVDIREGGELRIAEGDELAFTTQS